MLVDTYPFCGGSPSVLGRPVSNRDNRHDALGVVDDTLPERFRGLHGGSERSDLEIKFVLRGQMANGACRKKTDSVP